MLFCSVFLKAHQKNTDQNNICASIVLKTITTKKYEDKFFFQVFYLKIQKCAFLVVTKFVLWIFFLVLAFDTIETQMFLFWTCMKKVINFQKWPKWPFVLSDLSVSFTVAHLSWAIWVNRSQLLIWSQQSERKSKFPTLQKVYTFWGLRARGIELTLIKLTCQPTLKGGIVGIQRPTTTLRARWKSSF